MRLPPASRQCLPALLLVSAGALWVSSTLSIAAQTQNRHTVFFGSCARQTAPQPVWNTMAALKPDAFVFLGDNIYISHVDPSEYNRNYALLAAQPGFEEFRSGVPSFLAIWDDHDFGMNDAGADNPAKHAARDAFLEFFRIPPDSPRRTREGLYEAHIFVPVGGPKIQIILLDTRWFRSPLVTLPEEQRIDIGKYGPNVDPAATILGARQWEWLEDRLMEPADLRILASSIQIIPDQHGFEKWANFPAEKQRLMELIASTRASGVVMISGDRHYADISKLPAEESPVGYALHEVTASAMNQSGNLAEEPNRYRIGTSGYGRPNFGRIHVDWSAQAPVVTLSVHHAETGGTIIEEAFALRDLVPPPVSTEKR